MQETVANHGARHHTAHSTGRIDGTATTTTSSVPSATQEGSQCHSKDSKGSSSRSPSLFHGTPDSDTPSTPEPPPNGGYGWVCTACVAIINAHTWGINSSYGVFLAHYLSNNVFPGATSLQYAFVGSLSISCALMLSPVATITTREYGTRTTLLIGTVLEAGALISASFATRIWHLFLSQGVCFGFGMGFLFVGSVGIVPQWFTTRRSLANGIGTAGSGIGGLVYSLATGAMIRTIGLSWAFRVLGILAFVVNTICALLMRDRNKIIGSSQLAFDVSLFKRTEYLLILSYGWFSMFAYVVLLFSIANYATTIGLSASQASIVSALLNLGQAFGRPTIGFFSDVVGRINIALVSALLAALFSFAIWIPAKSFGVLIFYALVGGAVAGSYWTVIAPVAAEVVGLRNVPSALSINWLVIAIPCTFSEPIGLAIVSHDRGHYIGAQIFVGVTYFAAAVCMFLLRGWKIAEQEILANEKSVALGQLDPVQDADQENELVRTISRKEGRRRMLVDSYRWGKV